jgi:dTDP-3-amino-3,4,6-trideoxy-alpha-D-glucose transaminase
LSKVPLTNLKPALDACRAEWQSALLQTIDRAWFILGEEVAAFEREFAVFCHAPHAVGVANGTQALEIALRLSNITHPGQEVITSALTAPFTAQAILAAGATPVFADINPDTLLLDPRSVESRVSPRTAAIIPVHLYGQVCDVEAIGALADRTGAVLIHDACQAHGMAYDHRGPAAFSFYPTKNLGSLGDGGALVLSNADHDRLARLLRDGARAPGHVSTQQALNSRLDEIQACLLRVFLRHLPDWTAQRQRLAAVYDKELSGLPPEWLRPVGRHPGSTHVRHLYVIRARHRDELIQHLQANGIGTGIHYPVPLHRQPAFPNTNACPVADQACGEILSLPLWPYLSEDDVRFVCRQIWKFYLGSTATEPRP